MRFYTVKFFLALVFVNNSVYGNVISQDTSQKQTNPTTPIDLSSNATSSFSQKITNITESGFQKFKSGIASFINNVSNVFNRSQGSQGSVLGNTCSTNASCNTVSDATCDRGMCNCGSNFTAANYSPDKCLRIVKLSEACEEDIQCSKSIVGAICTEHRCTCSDLYTEEQGRCVPKRKLGSPCKVKDDCAVIPFADCDNNSVCFCPKPLIPSIHSNACLIMASPAGEPPCQEDIQCVATYGDKSKCINYICTCDIDYHPYNGKCIPDLKLGDDCNHPHQCIVSKLREEANSRICSNNTCVCREGFMPIVKDNHCMKGYGYQLQASLAWLMIVFILPYLFG